MEQNKQLTRFERFCEEISIPVVKRLLSTTSFKIRLVTSIIFLLLLGVTIYQCITIIVLYFSYPITVVVTETVQDREQFPAIVICPAGQFRASQIIDRMRDTTYLMSFARDIREIEADRNTFIEKFRRENVSFTDNFVKEVVGELQKLYESMKNVNAGHWRQINTRLLEISKSLQGIFPSFAAQLTVTEPIEDGRLLLHDKMEEEPNGVFVKFRELNTFYDSIPRPNYYTNWQESFARIMKERLETDEGNPQAGGVITELNFMDQYPKMVNFLRPVKEDIILNCSWTGKKCNILDVWTPQGLCFRVGAENDEDFVANHIGAGISNSANILIDSLAHEFPNEPTKVYFYQRNETEFAQLSGGIIVRPGLVSHMSITEIRENIRAEQNCGQMELKHFNYYTQEKCNWEKKTENIAKNCSCLSDMAPNYFADANTEVERMQNDSSYNTSFNFCSFSKTLFCAPNVLEKNVKCPNTCKDLSYEVDMVTNPMDELSLFSRLNGADEKFSNLLDRISLYGSFRKAPGSDQLDDLLDDFFRQHLMLIKLFWWHNDSDPYYKVWFKDRSNDNVAELGEYYGCEKSGTRFGECAFRTTMPCFGSKYREKKVDISNKTYSNFIKIVNSTVAKYKKYHFGGWKTNYTSEALLPFVDEISSEMEEAEKRSGDAFFRMKSLILQKFLNGRFGSMCILHPDNDQSYCNDVVEIGVQANLQDPPSKRFLSIQSNFSTDKRLIDQWTLTSIQELDDVLQEYSDINQLPHVRLNELISSLLDAKNDETPSKWDAPFATYLKWFETELKGAGAGIYFSRSHTLSSTFTHNGYMLDVSTVASSYAEDTANRENLRRALVDVSDALATARDVLSSIFSTLQHMDYGSEDDYYTSALSLTDYITILYRGSVQTKVRNMQNCNDKYYDAINHRLLENCVFKQSKNDATRTEWYKTFTKLIDTGLHVYRDGSDYHKLVEKRNAWWGDLFQRMTQPAYKLKLLRMAIKNTADRYFETRPAERASLAEISVFFRSFRRRTVEEQEAYGLWNALSDIGGALGLWLGITVLTLYELIVISLSPKTVQAKSKEEKEMRRERRRSDGIQILMLRRNAQSLQQIC